jgi:hypothetical protein
LRGLDGTLIGPRTRDLLQRLLEVQCRVSPVALIFEVWGAKCPSVDFAVDNREPWPLSYSLGLVGGAGGSLSRLGYFGRSQAEGAVGCREPVPATAVTGAAAQASTATLAQCGPTVLDLRQSMVRRLAQFASHCEARNGVEVATGLACLLVLAIKLAAPENW